MARNALFWLSNLKTTTSAIMAIDGEPCEPFLARNGAVVLAPGSRADAFVRYRDDLVDPAP